MTGVGSETMKVSPRIPGLVNTASIAEQKFAIDNIDRCAVSAPIGNGIGNRAILCTVAKFPFSPAP